MAKNYVLVSCVAGELAPPAYFETHAAAFDRMAHEVAMTWGLGDDASGRDRIVAAVYDGADSYSDDGCYWQIFDGPDKEG